MPTGPPPITTVDRGRGIDLAWAEVAAVCAIRALDMHDSVSELRVGWKKRGYDLDLGVGITSGYATIGMIGFVGRSDYSATGSVVNLASRLCDEAPGGHILVSRKFLSTVESLVESEPFGELKIKGFSAPVSAHNITRLRDRN